MPVSENLQSFGQGRGAEVPLPWTRKTGMKDRRRELEIQEADLT